jgi:hypothetical protein
VNQVDVGVNKKTTKKKEKKVLCRLFQVFRSEASSASSAFCVFYFVKKIHIIKSRARAHRFHEKVHFFFVFYFLYLILIMILAGDGLATTPIDIRSRWSTDRFIQSRKGGRPASSAQSGELSLAQQT